MRCPTPVVIDYAPVGAIGQAAIDAADSRQQRSAPAQFPQWPAQAFRGGGYGGGESDGQTSHAMPAPPTQSQPTYEMDDGSTVPVTAQQAMALKQIDANDSLSDDYKEVARNKVLGQPEMVSTKLTPDTTKTGTLNGQPYTQTIPGQTGLVTPQEAIMQQNQQAGRAIQQQAADTRTLAEQNRDAAAKQLMDFRYDRLNQDLDKQRLTLDEDNAKLQAAAEARAASLGDKQAAKDAKDKLDADKQERTLEAKVADLQAEYVKELRDAYIQERNPKPGDTGLAAIDAQFAQAKQAAIAVRQAQKQSLSQATAPSTPNNTPPGLPAGAVSNPDGTVTYNGTIYRRKPQ